MKKHLSTIILVVVLLAGLSLMLYPTVSEYWNARHQSRAIANYNNAVAQLTETDYSDIWEAAWNYNEVLAGKANRYFMSETGKIEYESLLNVAGDGIMGYVEIPKLDCRLPVYHGTDEAVLQIAIGHIEGTSLPVGGLGSHSVLSGHRGLPSAKLFTNLDQIAVGDVFLLHVLNETLTYEVDQILIVLPDDVSALEIDPEQDLCTLVTCTPYGINSHRLLVRGHRVETVEEEVRAPILVAANATMVDRWTVAGIVAAPMVLILMIVWLVQARKR